jgi:hypothetical protein
MKKIIATTLATLMIAAVSVGGATAAPNHSMYPSHPIVSQHHPRHWHQHLVCKTVWHHHHKAKACMWVPNHH